MADPQLVSLYYSAMEQFLGDAGDDLPPDVRAEMEKILKKAAVRLANQLDKSILYSPELREDVNARVEAWLEAPGTLTLNDLRENLAVDFGQMRALRIARTESAWIMNTTRSAVFKAQGYDLVQWVAADGPTTCETCGTLDGKVMRAEVYAEKAVPHPNCGCTCIPYDPDVNEPAEYYDGEDLDAAGEETGLDAEDMEGGGLEREVA